MDKVFCLMEHDDTSRKDLFQVIKTFSKVKDGDGKIVGPVNLCHDKRQSVRKMYDLYDEKQNDQPPKEPSHIEI